MDLIMNGLFKKRTATRFVVTVGIVSLFADMTYESARSINGSYLEILGASASTVGWVAGLGELLGYGLRFVSGYFTDRTGKYWTITLIGYTINLLSVPLLALAGHWQLAILLIVGERVGKALRVPPGMQCCLTERGRWAGDGVTGCTKLWIKPARPLAPCWWAWSCFIDTIRMSPLTHGC
jgi:MFS family permease